MKRLEPRALWGWISRLIRLALPFLCAILVPSLHAQAEAHVGDRARITSSEVPNGRTVGVLERSSSDSVVLSGRPISRTSISHIEVSTGRKSHWLAGAGVGLVAGAALGVGLTCPTSCGTDDSFVVPLAGVLLGVVGAGVGILVGGAIHSDRWTPASLGNLTIHPAAGPNGSFGIRVGFRF